MVHTVYFWLKENLSPEELHHFETEAAKLLDIGVVQRGQVGKPASTPERPVTDKSFSYSLHLEFASVDDHDTYQDHPDHHVFVDGCKDLWERVVVYDSEPV